MSLHSVLYRISLYKCIKYTIINFCLPRQLKKFGRHYPPLSKHNPLTLHSSAFPGPLCLDARETISISFEGDLFMLPCKHFDVIILQFKALIAARQKTHILIVVVRKSFGTIKKSNIKIVSKSL